MLRSLGLALRMKDLHGVSEQVVSREVFEQVLDECHNLGQCERLRLNEPHDSVTYRFLHRVRWHGILFIHLSRHAIEREAGRHA